jgi:hypothetical protein
MDLQPVILIVDDEKNTRDGLRWSEDSLPGCLGRQASQPVEHWVTTGQRPVGHDRQDAYLPIESLAH